MSLTLKKLRLRNFRNYKALDIDFSAHANIFLGDNGTGKTNLLEAIYLLSTGKSFRTPHLEHLILENESFFHIEAWVEKESVDHVIKVYFDASKKAVQINHSSHPSFSVLIGLLPTVLYSPNETDSLVKLPSARRRLINILLSQFDPLYVFHLTRYDKSLKQRNKLLKLKDTKTILAWEKQMSASASYLVNKRETILQQLNAHLPFYIKTLSPQEDILSLDYDRTPNAKEYDLIAYLSKHRQKELSYGYTLYGPHRDDLKIMLNQKDIKQHASEGQKQSIFLALKLAEYKQLKEQIGSSVLLAVDDFGSHLDQKRKDLLKNQINNLEQTFVTSPDMAENWDKYFSKGKLFFLEKGNMIKSKLL